MLKRADERGDHTRKIPLDYVLELDREGEILGGEWLRRPVYTGRDGKERHPDFYWMPAGSVGEGEFSNDQGGNEDNPYVELTKVRALLACANDATTCAPPTAEQTQPEDERIEPPAPIAEIPIDIGGRSSGNYLTPLLPPYTEIAISMNAIKVAGYTSGFGTEFDIFIKEGQQPTRVDFDFADRYENFFTSARNNYRTGAIPTRVYLLIENERASHAIRGAILFNVFAPKDTRV